MNGYEVARRVRTSAASAAIVLVAVTGYGQPDDQRRGFEAGFDAYLTKPVSREDLNRAITMTRKPHVGEP